MMGEKNQINTRGNYSPGIVEGDYNYTVTIHQHIVPLDDQQRTQLSSVLRERAESIASDLDHVIEKLKSVQVPDPDQVLQRLKALKEQFLSLHVKHLSAVGEGNLLLSHEITGGIHNVLDEIQKLVDARHGEIGNIWYRYLPRKYIDSPELGFDPDYDSVREALKELYNATIVRTAVMRYPGDAPSSCPPEIIDLAFEKTQRQEEGTEKSPISGLRF